MACRRSPLTAESCDPSKQGPDVLDPKREKCSSSPTATSAHPSDPAVASANTTVEGMGRGGGRGGGEGDSPLSLLGGMNLTGSAAPARSSNGDPEQEDVDWFEIVNGENCPAISAGAATSRASSSSATTTAASVEGQRIPAFNFSFAMGGWLMFYSFGVAKCLLDHGLHKVRPMQQSFIGSSAGSLAAAALALEADIDKASASACFA